MFPDYRHPRHLLRLTFWKAVLKQYWNGSKYLFKRWREVRQLIIKQKTQPLTRREKLLIRQHQSDIQRGWPWMVWFAFPFIGDVMPLAAHFLSRYLPIALHTEAVILGVCKENDEARLALVPRMAAVLKQKGFDLSQNKTANSFDEPAFRIDDDMLVTLSALSVLNVPNTDKAYKLMLIRAFGLQHMLSALLSDRALAKELLAYGTFILEDDRAILDEGGVSKLDDDEVNKACRARAQPVIAPSSDQFIEIKQMRQQLEEWVNFTSSRLESMHVNPAKCGSPEAPQQDRFVVHPLQVLHIAVLWPMRVRSSITSRK